MYIQTFLVQFLFAYNLNNIALDLDRNVWTAVILDVFLRETYFSTTWRLFKMTQAIIMPSIR